MSTVATIAGAETFEEVKRLVYHTVHQFKKSHGGDLQQLISEAHECYMNAFHDYIPELGPFPSYVRMRVWCGLIDIARSKAIRDRILKRHSDKVLAYQSAAHRSSFDISDFLQGLGEDAREVVQLVLAEVQTLQVENEDGSVLGLFSRAAIRQRLKDLGWHWQDVSNAFKEIQEALG